MLDAWNYVKKVIATNNNVYCNGKWGQFDTKGKQQFDCVCIFKACAWEVPINQDITSNQYSYIANHKTDMPDTTISNFYNNATKKSTDMSKIPTDIITFVYQNNGHIGIYNPSTKTVCETCAGQTMRAIERPMSDYPQGYWNKWSNGYYFSDSTISTVPVANNNNAYAYEGYLDYADASIVSGWCWNGKDDKPCTVKIIVTKANKAVKTITATANIYREDLKKAKKGNGKHAYSVKVNFDSLGDGTYVIKAYAPDNKQLTNSKTVIIAKPKLTATSYPDYTGKNYYRVRTSFKNVLTAKGSYTKWSNAYNKWKEYKDKGYHIYDNSGKQLD